MQYAIELFFDEEMEKKLFRYAKRIAEEKLSTKYLEWKTRPHITSALRQTSRRASNGDRIETRSRRKDKQ